MNPLFAAAAARLRHPRRRPPRTPRHPRHPMWRLLVDEAKHLAEVGATKLRGRRH